MTETDAQGEDVNLSVRKYLDQTVVPVLLQGLAEVAAQRPHNPIEFLAHYLLDHAQQAPPPPAKE